MFPKKINVLEWSTNSFAAQCSLQWAQISSNENMPRISLMEEGV